MKIWLIIFCCTVLSAMSAITTVASLERSVLQGGVGLWPDPWFIATLADAYFGFLTFYLWLAYKERSMQKRILWLLAILALGNFAMAAYLLIKVATLNPFTVEGLLLRSKNGIPELGKAGVD